MTRPHSHRDDTGIDGGGDEDTIVVGRIVGPWGISGHVKVEPLTDVPHRFSPGSILCLNGRSARVTDVRHRKDALVVKFDVVDDRALAESLRGALLTIARNQVAPLPEGEYYHFQIIDAGVWTEDGEYLGEVKEILPAGGADVYVVRNAAGTDLLLPAEASVILSVDVQDNRMIVRLPEGLR